MSYQVKLTPVAFAELSSIFRRIGAHSFSSKSRDERISAISKAIFSLDELPYRCPLVENEPLHSQGIRKMPVEGYIVYYKVSEAEKRVEILAITHGKQDQEKILKNIFDKHQRQGRKKEPWQRKTQSSP